MLEIRCSNLPRLLSCPASQVKPEVEVKGEDHPLAIMGTAVHEVAGNIVEYDMSSPDLEFIECMVEKYEFDESQREELTRLSWGVVKIWGRLRSTFNVLVQETKLSTEIEKDGYPVVRLSGSMDLSGSIHEEPETLVVLDWKSGYLQTAYEHQTRGYAWLILQQLIKEQAQVIPERFKLVIAWIRFGTYDVEEVTRDQLAAWADKVADLPGQSHYNPGDYCQYCPRQVDCPGRREIIRQAVDELLPLDQPVTNLPTGNLVTIYSRVKVLKDAVKKYDQALRSVLAEHGPQLLPDGRELFLDEVTRKPVEDSSLAIELLADELGLSLDQAQEILAPKISIPKAALLDEIKKRAARGCKGSDAAAFEEVLLEAGAIGERKYKQIKTRKGGNCGK